jgi:hypothetical protein
MNKFIKFNIIFFSCAAFLLNPVLGMDNDAPKKEPLSIKDDEKTLLFLHLLAGAGREDVLRKINTKYKDVFYSLINQELDPSTKKTLLMAAIEAGCPKTKDQYYVKKIRLDLVNFLIEKGANIFDKNGEPVVDADGNTCLHLAVKMRHLLVIGRILNKSFAIDKVNIKKALQKKYDFSLKLINARNKKGQTALDIAKSLMEELADAFLLLGVLKSKWDQLGTNNDYLIDELTKKLCASSSSIINISDIIKGLTNLAKSLRADESGNTKGWDAVEFYYL